MNPQWVPSPVPRMGSVKIRDIQTRDPACVSPHSTLDEAIQRMDDLCVRHLLVVEDGRLAGVVSNRELLEATGWHPARLRDRWQGPKVARGRTVSEIMHHPILTVGPDDDVLAVAVEAVAQGLGCLPVLENGLVQGIVTEFDLVSACLELDPDQVHMPGVEQVMTREALSVDPHTSLGEARQRMNELRARHLPVVSGSGLVGMLSDRDLRREVGRGRPPEAEIRETMTLNPITIESSAPLRQAMRLMVEHHIDALPVVDQRDLVGILTTTDLLDPCVHALGHKSK
jgi:CBS domain-containing protein